MPRCMSSLDWTIGVFLAAACILLPPWAADARAAEPTRIDCFEKVSVEGTTVRMDDVAAVSGTDADMTARIGRIALGNAPFPGRSRQLHLDSIRGRLKQNGFDWKEMVITGPQKITITRKHHAIDKEEIAGVVRNFLQRKLVARNGAVRIKEIAVARDAVIPVGRVTYTVKPLDFSNIKSKTPVYVHLQVDGEWVKKILAIADIEIVEDVVVARHSLKRGRVVTEDDVYVRTMDVSDLPASIIKSTAGVLGKKVRRSVNALEVMRTDLVEQPMLVRRGDIVQIVAESEKLRISATGMVQGVGGREGDRIRVINVDSDRGVYAKVVDGKTVTVDYLD